MTSPQYPHVSYNTGGIAGRSCGYIRGCENEGAVYGRKDVGGIVGQAEPYVELQLSESSLEKIEAQLDELNALIDQAASHASSGANSVSSRLNTMSGYVDSAAEDAKNIRLNVDASGSVFTESTPGEVIANAGAAAGGAIDGAANAVVTPDYGGLSSSISGLQSQLGQLSSAVSGTTGQLASDVQSINQKYSDLTDTVYGALEDASTPQTIITDASAADPDTVTLGKSCRARTAAKFRAI